MRLNIGAGKQTWSGYYCVDAVQHPKASRSLDLVHAFRFDKSTLLNPLPLNNECADELHNYHFIEHVYAWEAPALILEFHRLLKHGGRLVIECPDIAKCAKNLLSANNADQLSMWGFYGDPGHYDPYMCHRWGYTPKTLAALLEHAGFDEIRFLPPQTHGRRHKRDMRCEAIKC